MKKNTSKKSRYPEWIRKGFSKSQIKEADSLRNNKARIRIIRPKKIYKGVRYNTVLVIRYNLFSNTYGNEITHLKTRASIKGKRANNALVKEALKGVSKRIDNDLNNYSRKKWEKAHNKKLKFISIDSVTAYYKPIKKGKKK